MKNIIIVFILVFTIPFIGCRNKEDQKLVGTWKEIPFIRPEEAPEIIIWSFYAGDALKIAKTSQSTGEVDSILFRYDIGGSTLKIFTGSGEDEYLPVAGDQCGEYWVDVLDDEYLKMTKRKHPDGSTDAAFLRKELVKQ